MDIGYWRLKLKHVVITDIIFYALVSLSSVDMIFDKKHEIFTILFSKFIRIMHIGNR